MVNCPCSPQRLELVHSFDSIAQNYPAYEAALWCCRFLAENTWENDDCLLLYSSLLRLLFDLTDKTTVPASCRCRINAVFLAHQGLLPDPDQLNDQQGQLLTRLCDPEEALPTLPAAQWQALQNWFEQLLAFHDLKLPASL